MSLDSIDLIVADVPAAAAFFRDVVGLELAFCDERFAELKSGPITLMLSPDAMISVQSAAGIILHFLVDDVVHAIEQAREQGAAVLMEPMHTDWGTESATISGPEGIIVDFYRPLKANDGS